MLIMGSLVCRWIAHIYVRLLESTKKIEAVQTDSSCYKEMHLPNRIVWPSSLDFRKYSGELITTPQLDSLWVFTKIIP